MYIVWFINSKLCNVYFAPKSFYDHWLQFTTKGMRIWNSIQRASQIGPVRQARYFFSVNLQKTRLFSRPSGAYSIHFTILWYSWRCLIKKSFRETSASFSNVYLAAKRFSDFDKPPHDVQLFWETSGRLVDDFRATSTRFSRFQETRASFRYFKKPPHAFRFG